MGLYYTEAFIAENDATGMHGSVVCPRDDCPMLSSSVPSFCALQVQSEVQSMLMEEFYPPMSSATEVRSTVWYCTGSLVREQ